MDPNQKSRELEIDGITYTVVCVDTRTASRLFQDMLSAAAGAASAPLQTQVAMALKSGFQLEETADTLGCQSNADGQTLSRKVGQEYCRGKWADDG